MVLSKTVTSIYPPARFCVYLGKYGLDSVLDVRHWICDIVSSHHNTTQPKINWPSFFPLNKRLPGRRLTEYHSGISIRSELKIYRDVVACVTQKEHFSSRANKNDPKTPYHVFCLTRVARSIHFSAAASVLQKYVFSFPPIMSAEVFSFEYQGNFSYSSRLWDEKVGIAVGWWHCIHTNCTHSLQCFISEDWRQESQNKMYTCKTVCEC